MFPDNTLATIRTIMSFIKARINKPRNTTTTTKNTPDSNSPQRSNIPSFLGNHSLYIILTTLTFNINRLIINFTIKSPKLTNRLLLLGLNCLNWLIELGWILRCVRLLLEVGLWLKVCYHLWVLLW